MKNRSDVLAVGGRSIIVVGLDEEGNECSGDCESYEERHFHFLEAEDDKMSAQVTPQAGTAHQALTGRR